MHRRLPLKCVSKTPERPIKIYFLLFLQGKFTTKTDVWSFGVTLWEILTFAREQPYESQSDAKILSNLSNMWREGRPSVFLPTPHGCPREVRDLMYECWQREEKERPSFSEIHLFLQRKNLGFDPQHCQWTYLFLWRHFFFPVYVLIRGTSILGGTSSTNVLTMVVVGLVSL